MANRCSVIGCPANSHDTKKNLMKFPVGSDMGGPISKLWQEFTRQPSLHISSIKLCEDHFANECIREYKNGSRKLRKGSVPTVFITNGEKTLVPYDPFTFKYYTKQIEILFNSSQPPSRFDSSIITTRLDKVTELKSLCRFCFTKTSTSVPMNHMETYGMNPIELLKSIGSSFTNSKCFSDLICEQCILKVIEIEKFKNSCCTNQVKVVRELKAFDTRIKDMLENCGSPYEIEENWFDINVNNVTCTKRAELRKIEKIFERNRPIEDEPEERPAEVRKFEEIREPLEIAPLVKLPSSPQNVLKVEEPLNFTEITIKSEPDVGFVDVNCDFEFEHHQSDEEVIKGEKEEQDSPFDDFPMYSDSHSEDSDDQPLVPTKKVRKAIKPTDEEPKKKKTKKGKKKKDTRTYECFFCYDKFQGHRAYKTHKCPIKFRECEVEKCGMKFATHSGYSGHQMRVHGLPKVMQYFCPCCQSFLQMRSTDFRAHCLACKTSKYHDVQITCHNCKKDYRNLRDYAEHVVEHDAKGLDVKVDRKSGEVTIIKKKIITGPPKKEPSEKKKHKYDPTKKTERFCELCGRTFSSISTFTVHRHKVHLTRFTGEMYKCPECPFESNTKIAVRNHVRGVHRVNLSDCSYCGKTFQNFRRMQRHKKLQHERERMAIKCKICPDQPGFTSNTLLQRHIAVKHGVGSATMSGFKCSVEECDAAYATQLNLDRHMENVHGM